MPAAPTTTVTEVPPCSCPVTKTLNVLFQVSDPPATANHQIKWKAAGDAAYTTVSPNPTPVLVTAPDIYRVQIPNVPVCQNVEVTVQRQCPNNQNSTIQTTIVPAGLSYGCTQTISASQVVNGFYLYPTVLLDLTNAPDTVTFTYNTQNPNNPSASNPPNRFLIKDSNNNTVASSQWKGVANYVGEWGASLNTPTTGSFPVTKTPGSCFYTLYVDTISSGSQTDYWSLGIDCSTTVTPVVDPVIYFVSCSGGAGRYEISALAGTVLKIGISTSDTLSNNNGTSNCARIDTSLTASTGPTVSASSGLVSTTGSAVVGGNNSVFITETVPASGYLIIDTQVIYKNSGVSAAAVATLTIFEVNGAAKNITRSLCIGSQTESIPCEVTPACTCPLGYTASVDGSTCVLEETVAATAPTATEAQRTLVRTSFPNYSGYGSVIYTGGFNALTGVPIGTTVALTTAFWRNVNWVTSQGPLNRTAVWTTNKPLTDQRITFSTCINISQSKTYLIGVGCDNSADIKLNGINIVTQDLAALASYYNNISPGVDSTAAFVYWHIYPVQIPAGNNVLEVGGFNYAQSPAGVGVEIYDASAADLLAATSYTDLGSKLVFSTKDLGGTVAIGGDSGFGYSCPIGYVLKSCGLTTPICYKITTTNCVTPVEVVYSRYVADAYSCSNCTTATETDILVAFVSTYSPVINSYYLPRDRNGSVYKIKSTSTSTDAALVMSDLYRSTCAAICALTTQCYTVYVSDANATVTVRYINPVSGSQADRVCINLTVLEVVFGTIPTIIIGNGTLTGPSTCPVSAPVT